MSLSAMVPSITTEWQIGGGLPTEKNAKMEEMLSQLKKSSAGGNWGQ